MNPENRPRGRSLLICSALILSSCASLEETLGAKLQVVEDAMRGYRVQYHSVPAGAKIVCDGIELGVAPFFKYRDLTPEQKAAQELEIGNCEAVWPSGARTSIQASVALDQFPRFVHVITERPTDASDYEVDEAFGEKTLAERQQVLDGARALGASLGALAWSVHQQSKTSAYSGNVAALPGLNAPMRVVAAPGGIRWNWVQPTVGAQPNFGIAEASSLRTLIPLSPASNCVGTIIHGQCQGRIIDTGQRSYCPTAFVDGRCLGPVLMGD